jgi:subtilase family protein
VKVRYSRLRFIFGVCSFILLAISVVTSGFRVLGASGVAHKPQKNPKLSTPLVLLSLSVKQDNARPAAAVPVSPPAGFSTEALPKPLRDAIHARQMRVTNNGEVQVYIEVSAIDSQSLSELRSFGVTVQVIGNSKPDKSHGEVLTKVPTVQGLLPITMINQVSALPFVRYIRLPDYGFKNTGSVDSQGDQILQAAQVHAQFGVDGTGIRVGVISGGIGGIFAAGCTSCGPTTATPSPITTGDLPSATGTRNSTGVLVSARGGITAQSFRADSDLEDTADPDGPAGVNAEGTAMLEIVHDLAPGAQLFFANGGTGLEFEQAVNFLASHTDVVVDDISFFTPPFDGTSAISTNTATALNTDSNSIRGYFTAVGNFAQDHYSGQFVDSGIDGTSITGEAGHLHSFQAVPNVTTDNGSFGSSVFDPLEVPPAGVVQVFLAWNDPNGTSTNDYDLFLVPLRCPNGFAAALLPRPPCTISGLPVGSSTDSQTGSQDPTEVAVFQNSTNSPVAVGIVIQNVNNAAASRTFDVFIAGSLSDGPNPDHNFNTVSGSVPAEGDAGGSPVSVVSAGAIDQTQCSGPGNCSGSVEPYSSQGSTEATPQVASRMKPDVTATDDVSVTGAGGFGMNGTNTTATGGCAIGETPCFFAGTSAAAPHAAAIAALVLQALSGSSLKPATERANLRNFLTSTALPLTGISGTVPNNIEGFGLLDAFSAVKAALPSGSFSASLNPTMVNIAAAGQSATSTITVTGSGGFARSVSLACSVSPLPVNDPPTCFVTPSSVALSATTTSGTATVRIATTAGLRGALPPANPQNKPNYFTASAGLALAGIFLLAVFRPRERWAAALGLVVLVFLGVVLSCCGGHGGSSQINFGTPSGDYTVTVTASGGGTTQSTSVSLTLQ